jgi:general secretion pathway protein G
MSLFRPTIGLATVATALLFAQSPDHTRAREAALKSSLFTLRQTIDKYTFEQHKAPRTLQDLVSKAYVSSIPADPMTRSNGTWRVVMEDPAKSADAKEPGIFDVHSGSHDVSTDGTLYADW